MNQHVAAPDFEILNPSESLKEGVELNPYVNDLKRLRKTDVLREDMGFGANFAFNSPSFILQKDKFIPCMNLVFGSATGVAKAYGGFKGKLFGEPLHNKNIVASSKTAEELIDKYMSEIALVLKPDWLTKSAQPYFGMMCTIQILIGGYDKVKTNTLEGQFQSNVAGKINNRLCELLQPEMSELETRLATSTPLQIKAFLELQWKFMARIHQAGEYSRSITTTLLVVDLIRNRLTSKSRQTSPIERNFLLLACQMILSKLPRRIAFLAGIYIPVLNRALPHIYRFAGFTHTDVTSDFDIWEAVPNELETTVKEVALLRLIGENEIPNLSPNMEELLDIERRIVSLAGIGNQINSLLNSLFEKTLRPMYLEMEEYFHLANIGQSDNPLLRFQLPEHSFNIDFQGLNDLDACASLTSKLMTWLEDEFAHKDIRESVSARMAAIREAHARVEELTKSGSIDDLLQIAEVAQGAKTLILEHQVWFREQSTAFERYFNGALAIIGSIKSLSSGVSQEMPIESALAAGNDQPLALPDIEIDTSTLRINELEGEVSASEELLSTAETTIEYLNTEIRENRAEIHKLRTALSSLPTGTAPATPLPLDPTLLNRVVLRESLKAVDVLQYFAAIAPDRVIVEASAYQSAAEHAESHASIERMLDLIHKAVFHYLDAINSGKPDAEARKIFGSKSYSAQESDSTSNNHRLSAMRDFKVGGETIRVVRHLRVSNNPGKSGMRIYFEIINGKVVIVYAGEHLQVSSS